MDKLYDEIARVAHELYEKRGRIHGYHLEDWIEAEKIVMERHAKEIGSVAEGIKATREKRATSEMKPKVRKKSKKAAGEAPKTRRKTTATKRKIE